jgi:hypothetical protein
LASVTIDAGATPCVSFTAAASYLVIPQFVPTGTPPDSIKFRIGDPTASTVLAARSGAPSVIAASQTASLAQQPSVQSRLDGRLRRDERLPRTWSWGASNAGAAASRQSALAAPAAVDSFSVMSSLAGTSYGKSVANLVYTGTSIVLYADVTMPVPFTADEWKRLGDLMDGPLYTTNRSLFGEPSDLDGNGRVIVLFTPIVNALVSEFECATSGYVNGFFNPFDLRSTAPESNKREVFYAYVPDPQGKVSCAHSASEVRDVLPPTFIHELQHMISYNQHVLKRGGPAEDTWLNEAMSHIAEEAGSRYFEAKYPWPTGRASSSQLLPDSAQSFLSADLTNAYRWLLVPSPWGIAWYPADSYGELSERGAGWLFLRFLADRDSTVITRLAQSPLFGQSNIESATARQLGALLGEFTVATWADSLPGVARTSIPEKNRFKSRNLRQLFAALSQANPARNPFPYPLALTTLSTRVQASVAPTGAVYYKWTRSATAGSTLALTQVDGTAFPSPFGAQVTVMRLP